MEHTQADVIVIGAGTTGRTAALAAARAGQHVILLDEGPAQPLPGIQVRPHRLVWTATPGFTVEALTPNGRETYQAPHLIAATGNLPRVLPFPGWTLKGVHPLTTRTPGRRIVLAGCGPALTYAATRLAPRIVAIADLTKGQTLAAYGTTQVERVRITKAPPLPLGEGRGEGVAPNAQRAHFTAADTILVSYGTTPRHNMAALLNHPPNLKTLASQDPTPPWHHLVQSLPPATTICPCENLTKADLDAAIAEGATDMNQLRAFTRCGMGICQGRLCAPAASALVPGHWTTRPPLRPIPLEALLGHYTYADIPVPPPAPL